MISKEVILLLNKYENEILDVIEDQLSEYQNTDGVDRSRDYSDLQGRVGAIVLNIFNEGKNAK